MLESQSFWQYLDFTHNFVNPVVVMGPPSYNDTGPTTISVKDVTKDGFKFRLDEWDSQDGSHEPEAVSYVVMEEDVQDINGGIWEAGFISGVDEFWKTVTFKSENFDEPPVILTQRVTEEDNTSVAVTRVRDITASSFKIRFQEEESGGIFPEERVYYIAIQPSSGEFRGRKFRVAREFDCLTHEWYNEDWSDDFGTINSPMFIAGIQSSNEMDPCDLRYNDLSNSGIFLKIEEPQSDDNEGEHAAEDFGYLVVAGPPEAPSNLNAEVVFEPGLLIQLTWINNSEDIYRFEIEKKEGSNIWLETIGGEYGDEYAYPDYNVEYGKTYTYRIRAYKKGTGYSAYSNEASATIPTVAKYEFDKISVYQSGSSEWHTVNLSNSYTDPIVIMGPPSCNGNQPTTVRVKDVSSNGFKFQIDEWDYLDGRHNTETISYLVMEAGVYSIGGETWEAGKMENVNHQSQLKEFIQSFQGDQALLTQVVTYNDNSAVCTRICNLTGTQFQVRLQEEQGNDGIHSNETVHYIAVSPGTGQIDGKDFIVSKTPKSVTHEWYTINFGQPIGSPLVLANMNTEDGNDTSVLRYRNLSNSSVDIKVEEEQSKDEEVEHKNPEVVGYLVISTVGVDPSTFKAAEVKVIYENYIKLASPLITGNLILNVSSNYDRKASVELIDIVGRVVEKKKLSLKRGREDLNLGKFRSGIYFLRIFSDENNTPDVHKITVLR